MAERSEAMMQAIEGSGVTYEELAEMEKQFDDAETEIIRQQYLLTKPIYEKRAKLVSKIENFWPLVFEQSPQEIDQYIQPTDNEILASLRKVDVDNFEIVDGKIVAGGDPRSMKLTMEFGPNEFFTNTKLEKKFWYRRAVDGWCGLVSAPVKIDWKAGKDVTEGLLDLSVKLYEAEQSGKGLEKAQQALEKKIEATGMGGQSFFTFFGFIGRRVSAADSAAANEREKKIRAGETVEDVVITEEQEEREDKEAMLEIFPDGDDLAIAIGEDLWPSAIKYFTEQNDDDENMSDLDFESGDDFDGLSDDEAPELEDVSDMPASKKAKKEKN